MGNGGDGESGVGDRDVHGDSQPASSPPAKRGRGRPKLPRDEHGNVIRPAGRVPTPRRTKTAAELPGPGGLPPAVVDGQPNPEHWRAKMAAVSDLCHRVTIGEAEFPKGFNPAQVLEVLKSEAKHYGLDPKHLLDARTEAEKAIDAAEKLLATPSALLELADEELDAIEKAMDVADRGCKEYIEEKMRPPDGEYPLESARPKASRHARIRNWRARMTKLRRLRERARSELPRGGDRSDAIAVNGEKAAHVLRFMAYVGRSSMNQSGKSRPSEGVFEIAPHHCKMACDVWQADNGVFYDTKNQLVVFEEPMDGCIVICPPGHGKSAFGRHFIALRIFKNNYTQGHIIHAVDQKAEQNLEYVRACFEPDTEDGRRALSLFPVELADYDNNKSKMRLKLARKVKQPTLYAAGLNAAVSGDDSNLQWWDDPIDQKTMDQPTERERAFDRLNGTWLRRMRGKGHFLLVTATLWHQEDPINRMIHLSDEVKRNGEAKAYYRVSRQRCGGPKPRPEHNLREFQALWKTQYPSSKLRQIYTSMRNPRLYSAQYESNPKPEEQRMIQRLRYYDPLDPNHARFVAGAVTRLSLDPTATRNDKSDPAGVIYMANGIFVNEGYNEHGQRVIEERPMCRILDAFEIHATQTELTEKGLNYCLTHPVDFVHVEVRSGFQAFGEMFESRGIDPIRHDPKNQKKGERLKAAAPMLEDGNAAHGFRAVVEFPGVKQPDGSITADERYRFLYEQILDFGVCGADHCLDALTQVVNYLAADLGVGRGAVTEVVRQGRDMTGIDPRKAAMVRQIRRSSERHGNTGEEEIDGWLRSNWQ